MDTLTTTQFWADDVNAFAGEVSRLADEVFDEAMEEAMANFKLLGLVRFETIEQDLKSFSYTPALRDYLLSDDADDFVCNDDDTPVYSAMGKPYRGETRNLSKRFELCMVTCEGKDLRMEVKKRLKAVIQALLFKLYRIFWFGTPDLGQFGILNHPEAAKGQIESSFKWKTATDNQIAMQLVKAMKHMTNPKVIVAENIYNSSIGLAREGEAVSCSMRMNCIAGIIAAQDSITIDGDLMIRSSEELNANDQHGDMVIVYDADAVYMTKADIRRVGIQAKDLQNVHGKLLLNTAGLHFEYHGGIRNIVGAGDPVKS
jgi:hypothetical protein